MARKKSTTTASAPEPEATKAEKQDDQPEVVIRGYLVRDPELRHTPKGTPYTRLRIGEKHEDGRTTYHDLTAWSKTAIAVCEHLRKGRVIEAAGTMRENRWVDRLGMVHDDMKLSARRVEFVDTRTERQAEAA